MGFVKKELETLELAPIGENVPLLDCIYIVPTRRKHDSGYLMFTIVGENFNKKWKKILGTCSDVIEVERVIQKSYSHAFSIDMEEYPILRIFSHNQFEVRWFGISTFSFDVVEREELI